MIKPGTVVSRKGVQHARFVVRGPDGSMPGWVRIVRDTDVGIREAYAVAASDLTVITPAPAYTPGQTIRYQHKQCEVVQDYGNGRLRVKFIGYYAVHAPSGLALNTGDVEGEIDVCDVVASSIGAH